MSEDDANNALARESQWLLIEEHYRNGKLLTAEVIEAIRNQLSVEAGGIQGIVRQPNYVFYTLDSGDTQDLSAEENFERHLASMKGQTLLLKVIEVNREQNQLVLTQHLHTDEERVSISQQRESRLQEIRPGEIRRGVVTSLTRFTVLVDLEGIQGIIHRGHLSTRSISDPSERVQIGQEVEVMVLANDQSLVELSLVHVHLRDSKIYDMLPGQILAGHILALSSDGVYVDLGGPLGLILVGLVTRGYVTHPADVFHQRMSNHCMSLHNICVRCSLSLNRRVEIDSNHGGFLCLLNAYGGFIY